MISKDEIKHIAKLARLELDKKELQKMGRELSLILDYMEKLKQVDISKVDLKKSLYESKGVTREDKEISTSLEDRLRIMDLVPEKKDNYLKTRKIL
ncbi:MAG: Asp-tRNA(Asn)/Glu-tRNA(Gln) amidotransferase subunit GatC [Patescibacteria group bacterium]|nr:Asp-tRNA(Asn)/Glu-tRNA(Gln) amidotransferase subunit GatC [Patescibacteria group bacterium]